MTKDAARAGWSGRSTGTVRAVSEIVGDNGGRTLELYWSFLENSFGRFRDEKLLLLFECESEFLPGPNEGEFIAGPGDTMDWIFDFMAPDEFPEIAAATGAFLAGRRTYEVGKRMNVGKERGAASSGESYPSSAPGFVLTHNPPDQPDPTTTFLSSDIGDAVATALDAAGGKNVEILGADVTRQCLQRGLVDEILVYVIPVLLGEGVRFWSPGPDRIDLEPIGSTRSGNVTLLRFRVRK